MNLYHQTIDDYYKNFPNVSSYYSNKENRTIYTCPVCCKEYKTYTGATKHLHRKDCFNPHIVFNNTLLLTKAKTLLELIRQRNFTVYCNQTSVSQMKRKDLQSLLQTTAIISKKIKRNHWDLYCIMSNIYNINGNPSFANFQNVMKILLSSDNMNQFFEKLYRNQQLVLNSEEDSDESRIFGYLNGEDYDSVIDDLTYGNISLQTLEQIIEEWGLLHNQPREKGLDYFLDCLSPGQQHRFQTIINTICYLQEL